MLRLARALSLCLAAACTSSGGSRPADGEPSAAPSRAPATAESVRMTVRDYRSGASFELVSQAHTAPLDQYSKVAADASRKVQEDELMRALRDYLEDQGLARLALPGAAPALAAGSKAWTLEVADARGVRHVVATPETPAEDMKRLRALLDAVLATYNETQGWQAVDLRSRRAEDYFNRQQPAVKKP
jgi:hypothetical protein